jgi:hypothetical protein
MRKLAMVALALMCVAGTASVATAQGGGGGGGGMRGGGRGNVIDRWLTRPDTIHLSADEQKKVDDLKAQLTAEQAKIMADANGDRAAAQPNLTAMNTKYQGLVRAALTPANQAIFDKNAAAPMGRGRGGL